MKIKYTEDQTYVLGDKKILVIGDNKKIIKTIEIEKIITLSKAGNNNYREILKIENNSIWFFYENILAVYDLEKNKTITTYDLAKWNAHQVMADENNIWLISKNDGQLYGVKLEEGKTISN